jgi:hypothetical protein
MKIKCEWFDGKYPQFNVALSSAEGKEPFLTVKACRIVSGQNGDFVSWPATKNENTGKYWQHVWASEPFAAAVLAEAKASQPKAKPKDAAWQAGAPKRDDVDSDIPF